MLVLSKTIFPLNANMVLKGYPLKAKIDQGTETRVDILSRPD